MTDCVKFVRLSPELTVNLASIYAVQVVISKNPDYDVWMEKSDEYVKRFCADYVKEHLDEFKENKVTDETLASLAVTARDLSVEEFGECPSETVERYLVITASGINVYVHRSVYLLIQNYIDEHLLLTESDEQE